MSDALTWPGGDPVVLGDDVQHLEHLPLVLVESLDHDVEHVVFADVEAVALAQDAREPALVAGLDRGELLAELGVGGERLEAAQPLEVDGPAGAERLGDELGERRVGEADEAPRRDAVGDVGELAGEELVEVVQHLVAQQLGVELSDAVDLGAGDGGEVGHPHRAVRVLGDDRHGTDAQLIVAEALAHGEEELVVDAVDDLEVPRKQPPEQVDRPHLERFGKERVARVREALLRDRPRGIPLHLALVDQHAHELGHRDDRVRVVELEDHAVGQLREVEAVREHVVEEVGDRRCDEEVLLLQAQLLALRRGVLGVEHLRDVLGERLCAHGLFVVAGVEDAQVEGIRRHGAPEAQRVDAAVVVARHHVVARDRLDVPRGDPARALDAVVVVIGLGAAAERDQLRRLGVRELPRRSERQPRVGLLDLLAVDEGLAEDAEFVPDAVADARDAHGRERIDEAGRETPEAAVAETRLDLGLAEDVDVDSALGERLGGDVGQPRGEEVVVELSAEEVLSREVADALGLQLGLAALIVEPARHEVVAHGAGERQVLVVHRGVRQRDALVVVEVVEELTHEAVHRRRGRCHRGEGKRMRLAERMRGGEGILV